MVILVASMLMWLTAVKQSYWKQSHLSRIINSSFSFWRGALFLIGPFHCSKQHSILSRRSGLEAMLRRASDIIWTVECEGGYYYQHHLRGVLGAVLYELVSYYIPPNQHPTKPALVSVFLIPCLYKKGKGICH